MQQMKKYLFISIAVILTMTLAVVISINKNKQNQPAAANNSSQKIYNGTFENPNNNIGEDEKASRVKETEEAIKGFEELPVDTPYSIYDKIYEDIATSYISRLPSVEYEKYFDLLDKLEQRFLNNPNRQY